MTARQALYHYICIVMQITISLYKHHSLSSKLQHIMHTITIVQSGSIAICRGNSTPLPSLGGPPNTTKSNTSQIDIVWGGYD